MEQNCRAGGNRLSRKKAGISLGWGFHNRLPEDRDRRPTVTLAMGSDCKHGFVAGKSVRFLSRQTEDRARRLLGRFAPRSLIPLHTVLFLLQGERAQTLRFGESLLRFAGLSQLLI